MSSNLGQSEWSERDIDRVAALGAAARISPLGADVFRWLYATDHTAAVRVRELLVEALVSLRNLSPATAERVAVQAMKEFGDWACPTCGGQKEVVIDGLKIVCADRPRGCGGTGLRRFTDRERMIGVGVDRRAWRDLERHLDFAMDELRHADWMVNVQMNRQLERGRGIVAGPQNGAAKLAA